MVTDLQVEKAKYHCKHIWKRHQLEDVKARYLASESMDSIGVLHGVSSLSVARVLKIMGVKSRSRGIVPSLTAEQKVKALILLQSHTQQEVADEFGVSRWIIQKTAAAHRRACNE
jgi:hypothetical protein